MAETVIPQEALEAALEVYASEWPVIPLDVARLRCVKLLTAALPSLREAILQDAVEQMTVHDIIAVGPSPDLPASRVQLLERLSRGATP